MKVSQDAKLKRQVRTYNQVKYHSFMTPSHWRHEKSRIEAITKKAKNKEHLRSLLINRLLRCGYVKQIRFKIVLAQFGHQDVLSFYHKIFGGVQK